MVYHILGGCDVYYGLRCHNKFFKQVLMFLRAVAHQKTSLHSVELVPSLDLCCGQRQRRTVTNAVEGNLDGGTLRIDGVRGRICR